jgi:HlyD family secretion protein
MSSLFPPEIVDRTTESLFNERHTKSRIVYITAILLIIAMFAALPLLTVEITVQSRGIIRSSVENNRIISARNGRIEKANLHVNKNVRAGDTLLILNSDKLKEEITWYRQQIRKNNLYISDLKKIIHGRDNPESLLYQSKYAQHLARWREYQNKQEMALRDFTIYKDLYQKAVIAPQIFEEKKHLFEQARASSAAYQKQTILDWQKELEQHRLERKEQKSILKRLQKEKCQYVITAPVYGVITQCAGLDAGNFIVPNQMIAEISPEQDLLVECYLSPADIGMIRDSMRVRFQFDAFDYNHWGLGYGKVKDISNDIVTQNEQPVFKVRCTLNNRALKLKNGYVGRLKKGMTLTARFKITRRTIFQLLYDKVDDWLNPKIQKQERLSNL